MSLNLTDFRVQRNGTVNLTAVPRFDIEGKLYDASDNTLIADLTGPNAIQFPAVLKTLSPEQLESFKALIGHWLLLRAIGR